MDDILERYSKLPLGNICDANGKTGNMDSGIKPIGNSMKVVGLAYTAKCHPGDNLGIFLGMHKAPAGSVLVVDAKGQDQFGHFGEIMATACMKLGITGLVIDGGCRDAADIEALGFPVFCRGLNPGGTVKETKGTQGEPIICGGLLVRTGDVIAADRDGVVVVAAEKILSVLEGAEAIARKEVDVLERIERGETTLEIYKFPRLERE